jgi:hypothetical protein
VTKTQSHVLQENIAHVHVQLHAQHHALHVTHNIKATNRKGLVGDEGFFPHLTHLMQKDCP